MATMPANKPNRQFQDNSEETIHFNIKRSHFYALAIPLAFLLGLGAGYVNWGRVAVTPGSAIVAQGTPALPTDASGQSSAGGDIAAQLATIQRYEIPIDDTDPILGPKDAPITIVEFADFQCPFCIRHAQETYPLLLQNYGDKIRFVYKDFPLTSLHPDAYPAALSAQCAREQNKFWEYHDLLFTGTLGLGRQAYDAYAQQLGLDMTAFDKCLDDQKYSDLVQADLALGKKIGVNSTPTFFINGIALVGAMPYDTFAQIIDYELSTQPK